MKTVFIGLPHFITLKYLAVNYWYLTDILLAQPCLLCYALVVSRELV